MPPRPRTTPRKMPRQERSQATVDAILDATARILVGIGYDRASTNRIAAAAGVSIGSLYQYFPNKEALVAALVERHIAEMTAVITTKLAEMKDVDCAVAAREIVAAQLDAHMVDPKLHKVLMEQVPRTGRLERLVGVERAMQALVRAELERRLPELRLTNLDVAAFVLVNAVEGVTHAAMMRYPNEVPREELQRELTDLLIRYLKE